MTHAFMLALVLLGAGWTVVVLRSRRDLRVASVLFGVLAPVAAAVLLPGGSKAGVALATAVALPAVLVGAWRRRRELPDLGNHPLLAFVLLYAACAVAGLAFGLARGNHPVLAVGQAWTGLLFAAGFVCAGPAILRRGRPRHCAIFLGAIVLLCLPGLAPFQAWATKPGPLQMVRFIAPVAFYAPVGALLALALAAVRRRTGLAAAAFLLAITLISFTRSYWIGLIAGGLVLVAVMGGLVAHRAPSRPRLRPRVALAVVAALAVTGGAVAASPVGALVVTRVGQTSSGARDLSIEVRSLELRAALHQLGATTFTGVGSGGRFVAMHEISPSEAVYGPTNFLHNAYLYFPLKFGFLGFAALTALVAGVARVLLCAWRRARHGGVGEALAPALLVSVLALSATAPNLVDPTFSFFAGALAFLAGVPFPARRKPEPDDAPLVEPADAPLLALTSPSAKELSCV